MDNEIRNITIAMVLASAGILYGAYLLEEAGCNVKGGSFEGVKYSFVGGCMVKHKGKWLSLDNIRGFDDN